MLSQVWQSRSLRRNKEKSASLDSSTMHNFRGATEQPPSYEQVLHSDQQQQQRLSPQVQRRPVRFDHGGGEAEHNQSWLHVEAYNADEQRIHQHASPSITPIPSHPSTPTPGRSDTRASPATRSIRNDTSRHTNYPPPLQLELALSHAGKNEKANTNRQNTQQVLPNDPWEGSNAAGVGMPIQQEGVVRRTSKPEEEKEKKGSVSTLGDDVGVSLENTGNGRKPTTPNKDSLFSPLATNFQLNWQPKPLSQLIYTRDYGTDDPFKAGQSLGLTDIFESENSRSHAFVSGRSSRKTSDGETLPIEPLSPTILAPPQPPSISIRQQTGVRLLSQSNKSSRPYAALASQKHSSKGKKRIGSGTGAHFQSARDDSKAIPRIPALAPNVSPHSQKNNAPCGTGMLAAPGMILASNNRTRRGALGTGTWKLMDTVDGRTGVHETSMGKI